MNGYSSGGGNKKDATSIIAAASRHRQPQAPISKYADHPAKQLWCDMQWTNLTMQAKNLGLPDLPYFEEDTMLLSKEVNIKLWNQLVSKLEFC